MNRITNQILFTALLFSVVGTTGCQKPDNTDAAKAAAAQQAKQDEAAKQQQAQQNDEKAQREHDEALRKEVEADKRKHSSVYRGSKVWRTYVP